MRHQRRSIFQAFCIPKFRLLEKNPDFSSPRMFLTVDVGFMGLMFYCRKLRSSLHGLGCQLPPPARIRGSHV